MVSSEYWFLSKDSESASIGQEGKIGQNLGQRFSAPATWFHPEPPECVAARDELFLERWPLSYLQTWVVLGNLSASFGHYELPGHLNFPY